MYDGVSKFEIGFVMGFIPGARILVRKMPRNAQLRYVTTPFASCQLYFTATVLSATAESSDWSMSIVQYAFASTISGNLDDLSRF